MSVVAPKEEIHKWETYTEELIGGVSLMLYDAEDLFRCLIWMGVGDCVRKRSISSRHISDMSRGKQLLQEMHCSSNTLFRGYRMTIRKCDCSRF